MWTQVSREKPARRGWTLGMMCLAFIGTISLAYVVVDRRVLSGRQSPPGWPIAFTLPDAYRWSRMPESSADPRGSSDSSHLVSLIGNSPAHGLCTLMIGYGTGTQGTEIVRAAGGFGILDRLLSSREFRVGLLSGRMVVREDGSGETRIYIRGRVADTKDIEVLFTSEASASRALSIAESLCASIEITSPSMDDSRP
ncbi:MAG: hypothetical protein ACE5EC_07205 [Phycisphaerae bacterium]